MGTRSRKAVIAATTVLATASLALAGTKYQANLVPTSLTAPTLAPKGKVKMKDTGQLKAVLKGVVDASSAPVTTAPDTKYDPGDSTLGFYVVIVKGTFVALAVPFETVIPVGLKNGNGATALDLSMLFSLIPPGVVRSVDVTGGEVWGPISSAQAPACDAVVTQGFTVIPNDPSCRDGSKIGVAGINIP